MMGSRSELLVNSLQQLKKEEWKEFRWHLKERGDISVSKLENADVLDTVDRVVGYYKPKEAVEVTLEILKKMNQNQLAEHLENKHKEDKNTEVMANPEVKSREQFLQYSNQLTLDLNTVNKYILLSEKNRVIKHSCKEQGYEDHPDRFDCHLPQVLCSESVPERSYWEIEWTGEVVRISVSYKSIMRKGEGLFGDNDKSWSLFCSPSSYSFRHNKIHTHLPVPSGSHRIGVYVDHSAGILSFYSVSHAKLTPIHTIQTTFTQPLYPGFGVYLSDSSVKLCDLM